MRNNTTDQIGEFTQRVFLKSKLNFVEFIDMMVKNCHAFDVSIERRSYHIVHDDAIVSLWYNDRGVWQAKY